MLSFKGFWKYPALIGIMGWMFFLGILAGRGTVPVKFDTRPFSDRLEEIAHNLAPGSEDREKPALDVYEGLGRAAVMPEPPADPQPPARQPETPAAAVQVTQDMVATEITPVAVEPDKPDNEPAAGTAGDTVKKSLKKQTVSESRESLKLLAGPPVSGSLPSQTALAPPPDPGKKSDPEKKPEPIRKPEPAKKQEPEKQPEPPAAAAVEQKPQQGLYTLQVAAFRNFGDTLPKMAVLEEKGFSAYRIMGEIDGEVWYRIRVGHFPDRETARAYQARLSKAGFDSIIIRREKQD